MPRVLLRDHDALILKDDTARKTCLIQNTKVEEKEI
jgi:hypothetical protein